jgi:hypothetical protein
MEVLHGLARADGWRVNLLFSLKGTACNSKPPEDGPTDELAALDNSVSFNCKQRQHHQCHWRLYGRGDRTKMKLIQAQAMDFDTIQIMPVGKNMNL